MIDTRIETKHIIAELSVTEKVCLYNALYKDLASKGIGGDTELAHVNMAEMAVLRTMGGAGTLNPDTGLIQFMGGGGSPPPPLLLTLLNHRHLNFLLNLNLILKMFSVNLKLFKRSVSLKDIFLMKVHRLLNLLLNKNKPLQVFRDMVGQGQEYFDPSAQLAASSARAPTDQEISGYMSPYMQQVVDIQKREAERQGDVAHSNS
jgi:hypothetical protein